MKSPTRFTPAHIVLMEGLTERVPGASDPTVVTDRLGNALQRAGRTRSSVFALLIGIGTAADEVDRPAPIVPDMVLRAVTARLVRTIRAGDTVGRIGDVLVVVCEDPRPDRRAEQFAERLSSDLAGPFDIGTGPFRANARIGLAHARVDDTVEDLLARAARALDAARASRDRRWHVAPGTQEDIADSARVQGLRDAVSRGAIRPHVQPIVDLHEPDGARRIVGAESLLRWRRAHGNTAPAREFLPSLDRCGMLEALDTSTLTDLATSLHALDPLGQHIPRLWINITTATLHRPEAPAWIAAALDHARLPGARLGLEITDASLREIGPLVNARLRALRDLGVGIALDHAFAGPTSLQSLRELPIDHVKLDRSLVARIDTEPAQHALVGGLIAALRALGTTVVAIGVERPTQARRLRDLGCQQAQGLEFGDAMPLARLIERANPEPLPFTYLG